MNDRIKELMEEVGAVRNVLAMGRHDGVLFTESELEKFAELIVRECMDVLDSGENQLIARFQARQWLAEHFGVTQ
jgi:hypothetical protein